jgi:hypothetical protein
MPWREYDLGTDKLAHPASWGLVGFTYPTKDNMTITVVGSCPIDPSSRVVCERSDGKRWSTDEVEAIQAMKQKGI